MALHGQRKDRRYSNRRDSDRCLPQRELDTYIAETARLCAQPSVSAKGEGMLACAELVADLLSRRDLQVQQIATAGNPVIVAHAAGASERRILCEDVYGKPSVVAPLVGGSSPVYAFSGPLGIPVVNPGVGYWDSRAHAPDEHVRLQDFLNGARHIARIVDSFAAL